MRRMISSILAGYAWDTGNPYVADDNGRRCRAGGTVHRLILALLLSVLLAACASTRMPAPLVQLPTLQLPPSALPAPLQLQQRLQFRFGTHERELDALLEADGQQVRLAVQAMGQTGVRMVWDGRTLEQTRAPWLPPQVRGERVLG
jgi:hypothetical protein